jgi:hypothetical protein
MPGCARRVPCFPPPADGPAGGARRGVDDLHGREAGGAHLLQFTPVGVETGQSPAGIDLVYKHCRVKLYLKEARALRIETVVNDPGDLDILKGPKAFGWPSSTPRSTTACFTPLLAADQPPGPLRRRRALHVIDDSVDSYIDTHVYVALPENLSQRHGSGLPRSPRDDSGCRLSECRAAASQTARAMNGRTVSRPSKTCIG